MFDEIDAILYDQHLIDIIFSISVFLTQIFKDVAKLGHKKLKNKFRKIRKEERISIIFRQINFAYYIDNVDLVSGRLESMSLVVDDVSLDI